MRAMQNLHSHAKFLWQTYAWSHGLWWSGNNLEQYKNGVNMCGGAVDLCRSKTPDFGQWPRPNQEDDMPLTEADIPVIVTGCVNALNSQAQRVSGIVSWERYMEVLLEAARTAASPAEVIASVKPLIPTAQEIATAVVAALPPSAGGDAPSIEQITEAVRSVVNTTSLTAP
jgi:hypothetical protein